MGMKRIFILAVALLLATSFSFAETGNDKGTIIKELAEKTKLALKEDVVGEWEMIWQTKAESIPADDPFVAPYCMFYFSDNNSMATMGSTKPFDEIAATTWKLAKQSFQTTRYEFNQPGIFLVEEQDGRAYFMAIKLIIEDFTDNVPGAPKLKKGDLMLKYANEKGYSYLLRYLRRVVSK